MTRKAIFLLCISLSATSLVADGNRLTYLDGDSPYYPHQAFAKLTTPQWIGDPEAEAVVVLAVDDLRDIGHFDQYLRPIFERVKKINGKASVSIMTNQVDPTDERLQSWIAEGVNLDAHTADHPCPCLQGGNFDAAKSTYDRCVDMLFAIPNSRPVAFRFPCMDSQNTPSPRGFAEILNKTTEQGNFLQIDTSVVALFTADAPDLPRELVVDPDGGGRLSKYLPFPSFVNKVENYPYPYVVGGKIWEFPCTVPDDWQGFNLHGGKNPQTIADWKAALDATVLKQGTASFVFHTGDWIRAEQMVEIVDHAVEQHGRRVLFLNFRECLDRMNEHLLAGQSLRAADGGDNGVRLLDLNNDGFMDVVIGNDELQVTRIWQPESRTWKETTFPAKLVVTNEQAQRLTCGVRFGILDDQVIAIARDEHQSGAWRFDGTAWQADDQLLEGLMLGEKPLVLAQAGIDAGIRLRDLNRDGNCELIAGAVGNQAIFRWSAEEKTWKLLPFTLPQKTEIVFGAGLDAGLRFVDVDEDGFDDVVFSDEIRYSLHLFHSLEQGWSREVSTGLRHEAGAIPMISRNGTNNGAWFANNFIWVQNEDTARLPDGVDRLSFVEMLRPAETEPKSAEAALSTMRVHPGYEATLAAAEPLVMDPVSFDWGPDGKFWVVEMADYPLGIDGQPGGRVRYLQDTNGDGSYDKSVLFLSELNFPTGVLAWGKGVIVSAAPDIFYAEDTTGDGVADHREVLYTGFGEGNQQHRVNGFWRGVDNWIYVANGDSGGTIRSSKTGEVVAISGRDLRIRPDTGEVEAIAGQTQFGRATDDWGNWFGCNNSAAAYHYLVEDRYHLRNPNVAAPAPYRMIASVENTPIYPQSRILSHWSGYRPPPAGEPSRLTSANGLTIYRDDLLGPHFENNAFTSEPVHNLVHRTVLEPSGLSYSGGRAVGEETSQFLASSDSWFRPAAIRTGPDGAIWIADMYRLVIEHPEWIDDEEEKRIELRAGHERGRIYRVAPVGLPAREIPRLDSMTNAELVECLESPSGWQRDMAQYLLIERQAEDVAPLLDQLALHGERPQSRLHALGTLEGLGQLRPEIVAAAIEDAHAEVRRHAIRLAEPMLNTVPALQEKLAGRIADENPRVRLQLAYSIGEWQDAASGVLLGQLAMRNQDNPYVSSAALTSLHSANIAAALKTVLAAEKKDKEPSGIFRQILRIATATEMATVLTPMFQNLLPEKDETASAWHIAALTEMLGALKKRALAPASLLDEAAQARFDAVLNQARGLIQQEDAEEEMRLRALRLIARVATPDSADLRLTMALLDPQYPLALQKEAAEQLATINSPAVAPTLVAGWTGYTPSVRVYVIDALLTRADWCAVLLSEIEGERLPAAQINESTRQKLIEYVDPKIAQRAAALFAATSSSSRGEVLQQYQKALTLAGDPQRGKVLFLKECSNCHRLEGEGHRVGPDLTALTNKSPEALSIAILDPNRAMEDKYVEYAAITSSGRTYTGMLAAETGANITLVGPEGKEQSILREEIDELRSTGRSLMPEGFERVLNPEALADLMAYMAQAAATNDN
ncbi:MAG: PVC-type heme-binding CxxCH protein [Pirellulaceae bacterium]